MALVGHLYTPLTDGCLHFEAICVVFEDWDDVLKYAEVYLRRN